MNRLEAAIRAVMLARNIPSVADVAARVGLQKSALSKILRGEIGLSPTNLHKLVTGISDRPEDQFEILRAHLFDESERSGFPVGALRIERADDGGNVVSFADVPPSLQLRLRSIATEIVSGRNDDLDAGLRWIASSIEEHNRGGTSEDRVAAQGDFIPNSPASVLIAAEDKRTEARATPDSGLSKPRDTYPTRPASRAKK